MADAKPAAPGPRMSFTPILVAIATLYVFLNPTVRNFLGHYAGLVFEPLIGFGGRWPLLTIILGGILLVVGSTIVRHFTTDWLETARTQAAMRHFQREMLKARKDNNTYKLKVLQDAQPQLTARTQAMQTKQFKTMPITMIVVTPLYAWLTTWLLKLDYTWFAAPWNDQVEMFGTGGIVPPWNTSVFPHWILLYICLTIPLGSLINKALKYYAWRERWQKRHPGVHG